MLFWGLLHFNVLGRRPDAWEYRAYLRRLQQGTITGDDLDPRSQLRGRRPIAWLTTTAAIESVISGLPGAPPTALADIIRDVLGLAHFVPGEYGWLVELLIPEDFVDDTHVPTPLDGLDNPLYLPYRGSDGWGRTDDLRGPRGTPGLPEVVGAPVGIPVVPASRRRITIVSRGDLNRPPSRVI
jgi:hypothetical protein